MLFLKEHIQEVLAYLILGAACVYLVNKLVLNPLRKSKKGEKDCDNCH